MLLFSARIPKKTVYSPPDPVLLEKARKVRIKEIKMWTVIRETMLYTLFLLILIIITYKNRSELMYLYKNSMEQVFTMTNGTKPFFMKVSLLLVFNEV